MRIVHVLPKFSRALWSGAEAAVALIAQWQVKHGHEVTLMAGRLEGDPARENIDGLSVQRYEEWTGFTTHSYAVTRPGVINGARMVPPGLIRDLALARGHPVFHFHVHNRLSTAGVVVARLRGIPSVLTVHSAFRPDLVPQSPLKRRFSVDTAFRGVQIVTVQTAEVGDALRRTYSAIDVRLVPNCVEIPSRDDVGAETGLWHHSTALRCLMLARVMRVKNQALAVDAVSELLRRGVDVELVLAGPVDAEYASSLEERISELQVQDYVRLVGAVEASDGTVARLLRETDVLLAPSLSESQSIAVLEAWASAVPVVSSDAKGLGTLVSTASGGLVFPLEGGAGAMADTIQTLAADPSMRMRLGEAGQAYVAREHSVQKVASLYEDAYLSALDRR